MVLPPEACHVDLKSLAEFGHKLPDIIAVDAADTDHVRLLRQIQR